MSGTASSKQGPPRLALSPDEAAAALGISRDLLDETVGLQLRWSRCGRRKLVAVKELERWLERSASVPVGGERL
jgi:hypothetical protein